MSFNVNNMKFYLFPTSQHTNLYLFEERLQYIRETTFLFSLLAWTKMYQNLKDQYLFLTDDEKIKIGDPCLDIVDGQFFICDSIVEESGIIRSDKWTYVLSACRRIVKCNVPTLIPDGQFNEDELKTLIEGYNEDGRLPSIVESEFPDIKKPETFEEKWKRYHKNMTENRLKEIQHDENVDTSLFDEGIKLVSEMLHDYKTMPK